MRLNILAALPILAISALCILGAPRAHAGIYEDLQNELRAQQAELLQNSALQAQQMAAPEELFALRGKRGRKQLRRANWVALLQDDRARIHQEMGHPTYRIYELNMDVRTELWTYPEANRVYVFQGDRLIETQID
jgi:hypothetical protein